MDLGYKGRPVSGASVERVEGAVRVGMIESGEQNTETVCDLDPEVAKALWQQLGEVVD